MQNYSITASISIIIDSERKILQILYIPEQEAVRFQCGSFVRTLEQTSASLLPPIPGTKILHDITAFTVTFKIVC